MKIVKCCWLNEETFHSWPFNDNVLSDLTLAMRRRLTPLGRKAIQVVKSCSDSLDNPSIPWIISSRNGDASRRLNLLSNLFEGEMLSPTDFSMSVHNAIIGVFSIATGNTQTHSALAGGNASFETGLLESIVLLKEKGGSVGYVYYDYLLENKRIDQFEDNIQIECFAMIISEGLGEINIEYNITNKTNKEIVFNIKNLLTYLNTNERRYSIPVGGGEILFDRTLSKT